MSDTGDMDIDPGILSPEAAKKQVSQIFPSGWIFFPRVPTAEILNINTLLKYLCLIHRSCFVFLMKLLFLGYHRKATRDSKSRERENGDK